MLFIDGGHSFESANNDYEHWEPKIVNGGCLVIHDIFENPDEGGQAPYEIYQKALCSMGIKPEEAIAIEDTQVNLSAPKLAKINSLLYPGEYSNYTKEVQPSFDLMEEIFQI